MDDSALLSLYLRNGSQEAFTELVEGYASLVYSAAVRQLGGDAHLAKDVVQNVFTALARKAASLQGRRSLAGWLYQSTRFAVATVVRTESRRRVREHEAALLEQSGHDDSPVESWNRLRPMLDDVMLELRAADREAILLRYFANHSFVAIGAKLSLSENTARMRVARALDRLHRLLDRRGISSTAGALAALLTEQAALAAPPSLTAGVAQAALAGAGAAGQTGLVQFLAATKTKLLVLAAVAAISATMILVQQNAKTRDARRQLEELRRENREDAEKTAANDRAIRREDAESQRLRRAGILSRAIAKRVESDPAQLKKRATEARMRLFVSGTYAALFRKLQLDPDRQRRLETLIFEKDLLAVEVVGYISSHGFPGIDPTDRNELKRALAAATDGTSVEIRQEFGDRVYGQYQEFSSTLRERAQIERFAAQLAHSPFPLRDDQADQLVSILAAAGANPEAPLPDSFATEAGAVLSPEQSAALPQLVAALQAYRTILALNRAAVASGQFHPPRANGTNLIRE